VEAEHLHSRNTPQLHGFEKNISAAGHRFLSQQGKISKIAIRNSAIGKTRPET